MSTPCFMDFSTTGNSCENESSRPWASCFPQRECAVLPSTGTGFVCPEITASQLVRYAHSETCADTFSKCKDETSACYGRYCRPQIAEISGYSKLRRDLPLRVTRGRNFTEPHFRNCSRTKFYSLRQFHREICVDILFVDVTRSVAEQSHKSGS